VGGKGKTNSRTAHSSNQQDWLVPVSGIAFSDKKNCNNPIDSVKKEL
jgi:hypothetical protein